MTERKSKRRDRRMMGRAFALASMNAGLTGKNPVVGCVVTGEDGNVISEGVTSVGGATHAEQAALAGIGSQAQNGTAYVTLEPCRERSAGGASCSDLLISSGVSRVVCAISDPHPTGNGGFEKLIRAGISVHVGLKSRYAERFYRSFFSDIEVPRSPAAAQPPKSPA